MSVKNLLVELFVEELPPKVLKKLGDSFANGLFEQLKSYGLTTPGSLFTAFASPRRLAAHTSGVLSKAPDQPSPRTSAWSTAHQAMLRFSRR